MGAVLGGRIEFHGVMEAGEGSLALGMGMMGFEGVFCGFGFGFGMGSRLWGDEGAGKEGTVTVVEWRYGRGRSFVSYISCTVLWILVFESDTCVQRSRGVQCMQA